jgi:hypothetical protein
VAITIERDPVRNWIIARAVGPVGVGEVVEMIRTARAHVTLRMVPMIVDARQAIADPTDADIEQAVETMRDAVRIGGPRGYVALVAQDNAVYGGLLRYETRCETFGLRGVRAFRDLADAERWLEIVSASPGVS